MRSIYADIRAWRLIQHVSTTLLLKPFIITTHGPIQCKSRNVKWLSSAASMTIGKLVYSGTPKFSNTFSTSLR
jgi:hypothetical protein